MKTKQSIELPRELVLRAQSGDQEAFGELYQRSGATIYRTIFSMVQNENTAWDIHQNTYLLAYRNLGKLQKPEAFLPWLRRIAVNETVKELNREQPLTFTELADAEEAEPQFPETRDGYQPEVELDKREAARLVREILDQLPQKQRLIVGMYYYEGLSIKEIADTLQVSQGTVKTQLHLGRKKVETQVRRLEGEGVRLYGLSPMAFLVSLLGKQEPSRRAGRKAMQSVLTKTAELGGEQTMVTAKTAGTGFLHTVFGKVTIAVLVTAVAAGGVVGCLALRGRHAAPVGDSRPDEEAVLSENASVSTAAPTELPPETAEPAGPEDASVPYPADPLLLLEQAPESERNIPRILADTPDAAAINAEIADFYDDDRGGQSYQASAWGTLLVVKLSSVQFADYRSAAFCYDTASGSRVTTEALLERLGITQAAYREACREEFGNSLAYWNASEEEKREMEANLQSDSYLMALPVWPDEMGRIWVWDPVDCMYTDLPFDVAGSPSPVEMTENVAFAAASGTRADGILAVLRSGPDAAAAAVPTVAWNDEEADRILISPRWVGSRVSVWRLTWSNRNGRKTPHLADPVPVYTAVCGQGDCFAAGLERSEAEPEWYVTVAAPSGACAGLVLDSDGYGRLSAVYVADNSPRLISEAFTEAGAEAPDLYAVYSLRQAMSPEPLTAFLRASARNGQQPWKAMRRYCHRLSEAPEGDSAAWTVSEGHMEGDVYVLEAARIHEYYTPENNEYYLTGDVDSLTLADRVRLQAEYYEADPNRRYALGHFGDSEGEEPFEPLYFDLGGIAIYNPTLSVREVEITVNGARIGTFPLEAEDFCTLIDLDQTGLPGDSPVRVEVRVVRSSGSADDAVLEVWAGEVGGNISGAR